ncbi:MAG: thioredoxin family protein [Candidatus Nanopelagicales bacterium]
MDITLLYFDDCPNWRDVDERLAVLAAESPEISVTRQLVETPAEAERIGFQGSPSILVNGVDAFAATGSAAGLACRRYQTPDGQRGAPTLEQLRAVITNA